MARCGCTGTTCSCKLIGEDGILVSGAGTVTNPYRIRGGLAMLVNDTETVDLTLLGSGSQTDPYILSGRASLGFGDLTDADDTGGTAGDVWALQADGTYALVPPVTAAAGSVATGLGLDGDGSSGDPLNVRLDSLAGLEVVAGGLRLDPYTVATESVLDSTFGALPVGSFVSDTDGSGVWVKTLTGWATVIEDTGTVSVVGGNVTPRTGFTINSVKLRRRNGIVQFYLTVTTTVARTTGIDSANIGNVGVATVVPPEFRPVFSAPMRVISSGDDSACYIGTDGVVFMTNLAQPDITIPAGAVLNFAGTWIGA